MDEIDIPQYFLCPISLQIMKDPVTTVTGITYDRESIQHWLRTTAPAAPAMCPVTKQPLPRGSDLTPNHMLQRLIQAWSTANANRGIDRIPTPKSELNRSTVLKLVRDVNNTTNSQLSVNALKRMSQLAMESDKNRKCMSEVGVLKAVVSFVLRSVKDSKTAGIEEALNVLHLTLSHTPEMKRIVQDSIDFVQSLLWVFRSNQMEKTTKTHALIVLTHVVENGSSSLMERLESDFFKQMVEVLKDGGASVSVSSHGVRAALRVLIGAAPQGRNKLKIIEAGAVFELIELELTNADKKTSELVFCLLAQLCSCADGRQQLLKHAGGIPVLAKRLLRVSPATDDRVMCIIESIARFSATREVLAEMLKVGAVSKLCMVLQADCAEYLKKKAREILRIHTNAWSNSPCIQVYLLTMHSAR